MGEKQKRIDAAQRALSLLSTAYIVWPSSAAEVFLAGSFDGWATQVGLRVLILLSASELRTSFPVDSSPSFSLKLSPSLFVLLQRRMEKTSAGIFSLYLKLYPGQYEVGSSSYVLGDRLPQAAASLLTWTLPQIKFIVDGVWRVDPLRPVVYHSGFENNLLTVR